jgi:hypothetical protein
MIGIIFHPNLTEKNILYPVKIQNTQNEYAEVLFNKSLRNTFKQPSAEEKEDTSSLQKTNEDLLSKKNVFSRMMAVRKEHKDRIKSHEENF